MHNPSPASSMFLALPTFAYDEVVILSVLTSLFGLLIVIHLVPKYFKKADCFYTMMDTMEKANEEGEEKHEDGVREE